MVARAIPIFMNSPFSLFMQTYRPGGRLRAMKINENLEFIYEKMEKQMLAGEKRSASFSPASICR
ncbi:MAG TPA: hypothetical protein VNI02_06990, partial [Blastocatellia bacterium]|nr:hypothetical protein [Blastocatellia bacterium]